MGYSSTLQVSWAHRSLHTHQILQRSSATATTRWRTGWFHKDNTASHQSPSSESCSSWWSCASSSSLPSENTGLLCAGERLTGLLGTLVLGSALCCAADPPAAAVVMSNDNTMTMRCKPSLHGTILQARRKGGAHRNAVVLPNPA
jgi:hypothetical protein